MQKAIIISAPSGSGKTSIVKFLLENDPGLSFSVSATSRRKRKTETGGKDYYFISPAEFQKKIDAGEFIEWEQVYDGTYYGTLKNEINRVWSQNKIIVFDVDVKGGINLKKYFGKSGLSIFIKVQDIATLESRLRHRETETEQSLEARLVKARSEMKFENEFDLVILNDNLENACRQTLKKVQEFIYK